MVKWTRETRHERRERIRRHDQELEDKRWRHQKMLMVIKAKLDLYGEDALTPEELALVEKHHDFFYPEE